MVRVRRCQSPENWEHCHDCLQEPGSRRLHHRDGAAASGRRCRPGPGTREGELHEVRVPDPDARRETVVHLGLRAQGRFADVPDPDEANPLQCPALRGRPVPREPRAVSAVCQGGVHLRLPGRARPLDVGGGIRPHATPSLEEDQEDGNRREHRHLGHRRVADQARPWPQRPSGHRRHFLSGVLHGRRDHRLAPGHQGRLAPGTGQRLVHRGRLAPQRGLLPGTHVQLDVSQRTQTSRTDQEVRARDIRLRHPGRLRVLSPHQDALRNRQEVPQG